MKIGIVGYYGFNNLGDELNLLCMMNNLKEQFGSVEFLIFSDCRKLEGEVNYKIVGVNHFFPSGTSSRDALNHCDLLILGGGGLIYLGEYWFPFMDESITVPYIIYRVGIDDRKIDANAVERHKQLFLRAKEVSVRDHYSLKLCREHLTDKVEIVPEAIWNHPYKDITEEENEVKNIGSKKIGINLRSFSPEVYPVLRSCFNSLRQQGFQLNFIPCQVTSQNPNLNDNKYHRLVAEDVDFVMPDDSSMEERCRFLAKMDLCIGMRLHFVLLSLSQRVPVIALNYNNKVKGLMDELDLGKYIVNLNSGSLQSSMEVAFQTIIKEEENIRPNLDKRIPFLEEKAKQFVLK